MTDIVTVTPEAWQKVHEKLDSAGEEYIGILITVRTTGCSGYSFKFDFVTKEPENSTSIQDGPHKVIVGVDAFDVISGSILDWIEIDQFNQRFDIKSPLEKSRCGCGESFQL